METIAKPEPYFRTQRPGDPACAAAQRIREAQWAVFASYTEPGAFIEDFELEVTHLKTATGWSKGFIDQAICAYARLQELPLLRTLQSETAVLDFSHLAAIDGVLAELGPDVVSDVFAEFDALLVDIFTPTRPDQLLPHRTAVTRRMRDLIKLIDPERAYDPKRRKERTADSSDSVHFDAMTYGGVVKGIVELVTDQLTTARIRGHLIASAREHGTSLVDAAVKLLTGEIEPSVAPALQIFTPRDRNPGEPAYIPNCGWTGPAETAALDAWLATTQPKIVDLDAAATATTTSYTPTEAMRTFCAARDGTCIFPGCTVPAERCQLDHRIPFDRGGPTTPGNLYSLCAHHHNVKTDRRAMYVPDPATGEVVWLFADGIYELSELEGLLYSETLPTSPRWRSTLDSVRRNKARVAEFNAKGHAILDDFDKDHDLFKADQRIADLEEEYGLTFAVKAVLPDPPPKQAPDDEEPPYPDPVTEPDLEDYSPLEEALRSLLAA